MAVTALEWDPSLEILCDPLLCRVLERSYGFQAAGSTELREGAGVAQSPRRARGREVLGTSWRVDEGSTLACAPHVGLHPSGS